MQSLRSTQCYALYAFWYFGSLLLFCQSLRLVIPISVFGTPWDSESLSCIFRINWILSVCDITSGLPYSLEIGAIADSPYFKTEAHLKTVSNGDAQRLLSFNALIVPQIFPFRPFPLMLKKGWPRVTFNLFQSSIFQIMLVCNSWYEAKRFCTFQHTSPRSLKLLCPSCLFRQFY